MSDTEFMPVDDLTQKRCCKCGSDRELTRPNGLFYDGAFFGRIECVPCIERERFWLNCIFCGGPRHEGPC